MASPFSIFRKHQRTLMALLTLAAMFTFVCVGFLGFGVPQLLEVMGIGQQRVRDPVVVRTKWRTLTASDLHGPGGLIYRRIVANRFVDAVQRQAVQFASFQGFGADTEEDVVMAEVLRHKAEEMGLSVDDAAVDRFLLAITGERLTAQGFINARDALNVSEELVYSVLRDELLAYNASVLLGLRDEGSMFASEAPTLTPAELRDSYHKLRDRAEIEAVAVPVEAFLHQTGEPTEEQLREYFERYREFFGHPMSPMPGFRQRRRIAAEYVRADFDKTVEAMTVSDEEVEAYYEENKDTRYRLPEESEPEQEEGDADAEDAKSDTDASPDDPTADDAAAKPEGEKKSTVETPKLFSEPSEKPEPQAEAGSQPSPEKPEATDSDATAGDANASSQGESSKETTSAPPGSDEPRASSDPAGPVTSQPEAPEQQAQDSSGATGSPPQNDTEKEETKEGESDAQNETDEPEGVSPDEKPGAAAQSGPRYTPLDDALREEIRQELKRAEARALIDELFGELQYEVFDAYYEQYVLWETEQEEAAEQAGGGNDTKAQPRSPPTPPAPQAVELFGNRIEGAGSPSELLKRSVELARAHERFGQVALEYGTTGPVNIFELSDLEGIGEARECMRGEPVTLNAPPFPSVAFQLPGLYASAQVCEIAETEEEEATESFNPEPPDKSHTYLFWKVRDEPEFLPQELSEVRDQVQRAWRMDRARELARQRAEQLALVAREKGSGLAESLAGEKVALGSEADVTVLHPAPFTWLSRPEDRRFEPPGITAVEGIENTGEEFMRTVFNLSEGEVGVAPDGPEKTFYVVRAEVMQPAPRSDLLSEDIFGFMSDYQQLAQQLRMEDRNSLARQLIEEAGVKWEQREGG